MRVRDGRRAAGDPRFRRVRAPRRSRVRALIGAAITVVTAVTLVTAVAAASIRGYGALTLPTSDAPGLIEFDPSLGISDATFTVLSGGVTKPSGSSVWLSQATPFGAVFGSSRNLPYLGLSVPVGGSSITIEFDQPTPAQTMTAGWGFALGDIDAENVTVSAIGPGGPLSVAELGWSVTDGAFNYCSVSPRPSSCRAGSGGDLPNWNPATSTLEGNIGVPTPDTDGASGWFRPTVPVTSLTLSGAVLVGIPAYQLWIAALEDVGIGGRVEVTVGDRDPQPAEGVTLNLLDESGVPVTENGEPVVAVTGADGSYGFGDLEPVRYRVEVDLPEDATAVGPTVREVDLQNGPALGVDFSFALPSPPDPDPDPDPDPGPDPTPDPAPDPAPDPHQGDGSHSADTAGPGGGAGRLPATGVEHLPVAVSGASLMVLGGIASWWAHRRNSRRASRCHGLDG